MTGLLLADDFSFLFLSQWCRGLHLSKRYRNLCSFFKAHISWQCCHSLKGQSSDGIPMTDLFQSTVGLTFEDERRWQRSSEHLNVTVSFMLTLWGCQMPSFKYFLQGHSCSHPLGDDIRRNHWNQAVESLWLFRFKFALTVYWDWMTKG